MLADTWNRGRLHHCFLLQDVVPGPCHPSPPFQKNLPPACRTTPHFAPPPPVSTLFGEKCDKVDKKCHLTCPHLCAVPGIAGPFNTFKLLIITLKSTTMTIKSLPSIPSRPVRCATCFRRRRKRDISTLKTYKNETSPSYTLPPLAGFAEPARTAWRHRCHFQSH
jgi:hypothetical protein